METHFGKLRVDVSSYYLYFKGIEDEDVDRWLAAQSKPKTFFRWDCSSQTSNPPIRRPDLTAHTQVRIGSRRVLNPLGPSFDMNMTTLWLAAAGFATEQDLIRDVRRVFPPLKVPIPWDTFWEPYKDDYSLKLTALVHYMPLVASPRGLTLHDRMFIMVPQYLTIQSIVTGSCGGTEPVGKSLEGFSYIRVLNDGDDPEIFQTLQELEIQIERENEEREELDKRMHEALGDHPIYGPSFPDPEEEGD